VFTLSPPVKFRMPNFTGMPEDFTLSVSYKGIQREVHCRLRVSAYTYQFLCSSGDSEWIFEKDDEGRLRALDAEPFSQKGQKADPGLVKVLMKEMERILQ
jgi:hypothetical protein